MLSMPGVFEFATFFRVTLIDSRCISTHSFLRILLMPFFLFIYPFSISVMFFLVPYLISKLFPFLCIWFVVYPCVFSIDELVEFSFVFLVRFCFVCVALCCLRILWISLLSFAYIIWFLSTIYIVILDCYCLFLLFPFIIYNILSSSVVLLVVADSFFCPISQLDFLFLLHTLMETPGLSLCSFTP